MKHSILVGIGGCGVKCVEAAIHLASSQPYNHTIYPIIIDQDKANGNIERLKNVIESYLRLNESIKSEEVKWPFSNKIIKYDEFLPSAPVDENLTFAAAIGEPSLQNDERSIINALYTPNQLSDYILNQGFKKRAHMGALLFEEFILKEKNKDINQKGLKYLCNQLKTLPDVEISIFASLFGGTGISGFSIIGKFFKENLQNKNLRLILLTPYFALKSGESENEDASLVKSDSDMVATRIALEIYGQEIENIFDKIFLIGSDLNHVTDEEPSNKFVPYGKEQVNKAHLFELIAASTIFSDFENINYDDKIFEFTLSTADTKLPIEIGGSKISLEKFFNIININYQNFKVLVKFSNLLNVIDKNNLINNSGWVKRQPWINKDEISTLLEWGRRYFEWLNEMKSWKSFKLNFKSFIKDKKDKKDKDKDNDNDAFKFNSLLSIYLHKNKNNLASILKTIENLKL